MEIQYDSHAEAATFGALVHSDSELAQLFGKMMLLMDADTDYDTVRVGCDSDTYITVAVEDSPYIIVMDEDQQKVTLFQNDDEGEEYDFDEDGIEMVVDIMASRILGEEYS
jgi:hypothetical protein